MTTLVSHVSAKEDARITYSLSPPAPGGKGLLVVVHGHSRSLKLAEAAAKRSVESGIVVLAPVFDIDHYDGFQTLRGEDGPLAAARALDAACESAADRLGASVERFAIMGYSGGAQFAHRYAMMFPEKVTCLVSAAAGWYTMPCPDREYPLGCAPSQDIPEGIPHIDAFLKIPTLVMVGEYDTERDKQLRHTRSIDDIQGWNRLDRARRWAGAVSEASRARDLAVRVSLRILPHCGHSVSEAIYHGDLINWSMQFLAEHRATD